MEHLEKDALDICEESGEEEVATCDSVESDNEAWYLYHCRRVSPNQLKICSHGMGNKSDITSTQALELHAQFLT